MNRLFVLKDVPYASNGAGLITNIHEVGNLEAGALAVFNPKGVLLTNANLVPDLQDAKDFIIAVGMADDGTGVDNTQILQINRKATTDVNLVNYRAYTRPVITIGGITPAESINIPANSVGELSIRVTDNSLTSRNFTASKSASIHKRANMTAEAAIDKLIEVFNKDNTLSTAAKIGTSPDFGITITPDADGVTLGARVNELLEGTTITSSIGVHGSGVGKDVRIMEQDFSVELGNGNYIDYTTDWYSKELEATLAGTYDLTTLTWAGIHETPSSSNHVMHNRLIIASLSTVTAGLPLENQSAGDIRSLFSSIIGGTFSGTGAAEAGRDDGTEYDGVAGN